MLAFPPSIPLSLSISLFLLFSYYLDLDDEIKNIKNLVEAVKDICDWRGLCLNLGVDQTTMDALIYSSDGVNMKKLRCLQAYFDQGKAKWSEVVKAVKSYPMNNKHVANNIAEAYGVSFEDDDNDYFCSVVCKQNTT